MGLFNRKKDKNLPIISESTELMEVQKQEEPMQEETSETVKPETELQKNETIILGVNRELVTKLKDKVEKVKAQRTELADKYKELVEHVKVLDGKFDALKIELVKPFMDDARKELNDVINTYKSRISKNEEELIKISKAQEEFEYVSSFQDYYQLIKLCIYMMTHAENSNTPLIKLILNTIHSLASDMVRNNFWNSGKDAIITSLLNLKTYWRMKDNKIEELIGNEVKALENLR